MAGKQNEDKIFIEFTTASLYRADGFESGDLLKKYFPFLSPTDLREVLADAVVREVVPQLDQNVSVMVLPSARNPVRVTSVGTESVVWQTANSGTGPAITPAVVSVSVEKVRKLIPKQAAKAEEDAQVEPEA